MNHNTAKSNMNQDRDRYELILVQLTNTLVTATRAERDKIQAKIDDLKDGYFRSRQKHDQDSYTPPVTTPKQPPKVFQKRKAKKRAPEPAEWELLYPPILANRKAYSDAGRVAKQAHRNPFKTRDRKDDMRYQTHGAKNPRAKR